MRAMAFLFNILLVYSCAIVARGTFTLTVKFINYTNPTGLCAECNTRLGDVSLDQIVPVCCDESPLKADNCDNTGEARCDTRFRWTLRTFGSSLETRPGTSAQGESPPYNVSLCPQSSTTCPFSEMSKTFEQGDLTFLERPNPLPLLSTDPWTGRTQFFIEAVESGVPNIIDSFLINLDNLQLGADFTEEMTFTGYHNISHMTMSFKVECAPNYCGPGCTTEYLNDPVFMCQPDGSIVCTDRLRDLSTNCMSCLQGRDPNTNCTTCLQPGYDAVSSCTQCLPNHDLVTNCAQCLPGFNTLTNCTTCMNGFIGDNCTHIVDSCRMSPCANGGTCFTSTTIPGDYFCQCASGFGGHNCDSSVLAESVNSTILGALLGVTLIVVVILVVIVIIMCFKRTKTSSGGHTQSGGASLSNTADIQLKDNIVYEATNDNIELQPNVLYGLSTTGDPHTTTEGQGVTSTDTNNTEYEYIDV